MLNQFIQIDSNSPKIVYLGVTHVIINNHISFIKVKSQFVKSVPNCTCFGPLLNIVFAQCFKIKRVIVLFVQC